ncbi:hypothetical protein NQ318_012666 [Aromia moschata]|uniref:Uncharacterized protein n=1 Tax=Aromia moschata TaxID=1265417 RepID=A0AAV8YIY3_9CUCU|nr:hypothetical protein NQ318_012666 [Aromia moschata]
MDLHVPGHVHLQFRLVRAQVALVGLSPGNVLVNLDVSGQVLLSLRLERAQVALIGGRSVLVEQVMPPEQIPLPFRLVRAKLALRDVKRPKTIRAPDGPQRQKRTKTLKKLASEHPRAC